MKGLKRQFICEVCLFISICAFLLTMGFTAVGIIQAIYTAARYGEFEIILLLAIPALTMASVGVVCGSVAILYANKKSSVWGMITFANLCFNIASFAISLYVLLVGLFW